MIEVRGVFALPHPTTGCLLRRDFVFLSTSQVPESGHPDDFALQDDFSANMGSIDVGDEGEIWCHKVVHGYRWYRVRILRRSNLDEVSVSGWVDSCVPYLEVLPSFTH